MNKTVKRIVVILIILILLPAAFLTINEFVSLNKNEEVLGRIYSNQLDAILYSVNQYSEDVVSDWASKIDKFHDDLNNFDDIKIHTSIDSFYSQFPSLSLIFVADSVNSEIKFVVKKTEDNFILNKLGVLKKSIKNIISENQLIVKRLLTYKKAGYRKLEPIKSDTTTDASILLFIEETPEGLKRITGMMIDPKEFTYRILSPKIQEIAQKEFLISVFNPKENFQFNSSRDFKVKEVQQSKPLMDFP